MFDVHAVEMQTPSAIRISREPGAQNYSTLAISCLMECPQTEELARVNGARKHIVHLLSPALHVLSVISGDRQGLVFQAAAGRTLSKMSRSCSCRDEPPHRDPPDKPENTLRHCIVAVARQSLDALRGAGIIADDAYRPSRLVGAHPKPTHE